MVSAATGQTGVAKVYAGWRERKTPGRVLVEGGKRAAKSGTNECKSLLNKFVVKGKNGNYHMRTCVLKTRLLVRQVHAYLC